MRDAFKLSDEYAAKWTPQGLYIFSYDEGEIRERIHAMHLTLGETELRALANEACAAFGGCDFLETARKKHTDLLAALEAAIPIIEQVVNGINDEWTRWFSAPLLQDDEREWLERAEEFVEQARAAVTGAQSKGSER